MNDYDKFVEVAHRYFRMVCGMVFMAMAFFGVMGCLTCAAWINGPGASTIPHLARVWGTVGAVAIIAYAAAAGFAGLLLVWSGARDIQVLKSLRPPQRRRRSRLIILRKRVKMGSP